MMQTFSSVIFENCFSLVSIVDQILQPSQLCLQIYTVDFIIQSTFLVDCKISSFYKHYMSPSEADLEHVELVVDSSLKSAYIQT